MVDRGELLAFVGASGSGKSTLLNILAGLDVPTAGSATVAGHDLLNMSARRRLQYRRRVVGFIWQQASRNLVPYLTAAENVALPMRLAGRRRTVRCRAMDLLGMIGVEHCAGRRPDQMSGGEQQRTAVAVAVANDPEVLFADEPTGDGATELVTEEYAVLDRVGRVQLPRSYVDELELRDRVKLTLEPDHVEVRPAHEVRPADGEAGA